MNKTTLVFLGVSGVAMLAAGYFLGSHRSAPERSTAKDPSDDSAQLSALVEEVRALKRQTAALKARPVDHAPYPPRGVDAQGQDDPVLDEAETEDRSALDDPSPQQQQERMASQEIIDRATSRGVWTKEDAEAFRLHMAGAGPEGHMDLMHQLADLMNSGDLKVDEGVRRPF